jgi:NAD(P)-dependent dehydrogenase (short-subunit alcohol dehydrogenase family)
MTGTVLVTGATDGLGKAVSIELAKAGATVLVHGRTPERAEAAVADIRAASGSTLLRACAGDFASLAQVRSLAEGIAAAEPRLDVLVNNAGIGTADPGGGERIESADGHELRFAVNYLAPFLLTRILEPLLVRSAPSRIVNVASAGQAPVDFHDVMLEDGYDGGRAYSQSKLAMVAWTFDTAERLAGQGVTATALHPGTYMPTKMVLAAGIEPFDSLESGVRATLRLVADPALDGVTGRYFDRLEEARARPQAYDPDARRKLRELSERLVELTPAR